MHDLLSVSRLLDDGVKICLDANNSHLTLPNGERVHAWRDNGLFLIDYLVPVSEIGQKYASDNSAAACAYGTMSKNENNLRRLQHTKISACVLLM